MLRDVLKVSLWICLLNVGPFIRLHEFRRSCHRHEERYVRRYTNRPFVIWELARQLQASDKVALETICTKAHEKSGKGRRTSGARVHDVKLRQEDLQFKRNWTYNPMKVDVVSYKFREKEFYITLGLTPDCVFYLRPSESSPGRFRLEKPVCGVVGDSANTRTEARHIVGENRLVQKRVSRFNRVDFCGQDGRTVR